MRGIRTRKERVQQSEDANAANLDDSRGLNFTRPETVTRVPRQQWQIINREGGTRPAEHAGQILTTANSPGPPAEQLLHRHRPPSLQERVGEVSQRIHTCFMVSLESRDSGSGVCKEETEKCHKQAFLIQR